MKRLQRLVLIVVVVGLLPFTACTSAPTSEPVRTAPPLLESDLDTLAASFLADLDPLPFMIPAELDAVLQGETPPFLLDVRTLQEIQDLGYIEGATAIPLSELARRVDLLPSSDTAIVVYCRSGRRATVAMVILRMLGWHDVVSLVDGSYSAWVSAGYPVVHALPTATQLNAAHVDPSLLSFMDNMLMNAPANWGYIDPDRLYAEFESNPDLVLLDVRSSIEVAQGGVIEGALQIPLEDFLDRKNDWPVDKNTMIVIYGGEKLRSLIAMTILWLYDYRLVYGI